MQSIDRASQPCSQHTTSRLWRHCRRAAAIGIFCAPLPSCASPDDSDAPFEETDTAESAALDNNGLNPNGWNLNGLNWNGLNWNGLNWNGLHTVGLYLNSSGNVSSNIQSWLNDQPGALSTMPYLVACAAPSGTTVSATVGGDAYAWPGKFGLASAWKDGVALSTTDQEWVSACLLAHVNLAGLNVMVSFRGPPTDLTPAGLATTDAERSSYGCREAAFMGNIFAGHATEALPIMQCHENGGTTGTGRSCDPSVANHNCAVDCFAACDTASDSFESSTDSFGSCNIRVNGTARTYTNIITTYLPTDPSRGCLGWGHEITSHNAVFSSSGSNSQWSWSWGWGYGGSQSCSMHCGGYTASGCSCAPDCTAAGTCCSDYNDLCGTPPPSSGPTHGVSTCPAGYTTYTGDLSSSNVHDYFPSSGYASTETGTHHGMLLGPETADFDLGIQFLSGTTWKPDALSGRASSSESIHYFYGVAGRTYRWKVNRRSGSGSYTFCLKRP